LFGDDWKILIQASAIAAGLINDASKAFGSKQLDGHLWNTQELLLFN